MKLLKRFPVVATPSHLAYSPDSSTVFVSLQDSDKLAAFDLRTMTEKWIVPIGKTPAGVLWLNGRVLVADMGTDYLAAADPATGKVVAHIETGKGAHQLFLSPDGKILWVNNRAGGTTVSLDSTTLKPIRSLQYFRRPRRSGLRAEWKNLDHAALGGEGGGARPGHRLL